MTGKQKQRLAAHLAAMNAATASAVVKDATTEQQGQLLHVGKEDASDKLAGSISRGSRTGCPPREFPGGSSGRTCPSGTSSTTPYSKPIASNET